MPELQVLIERLDALETDMSDARSEVESIKSVLKTLRYTPPPSHPEPTYHVGQRFDLIATGSIYMINIADQTHVNLSCIRTSDRLLAGNRLLAGTRYGCKSTVVKDRLKITQAEFSILCEEHPEDFTLIEGDDE